MTELTDRLRFFTITEIADYCGAIESVVESWIAKGKLIASITPGGEVRIAVDDFRDFLNATGIGIREEFFADRTCLRAVIVCDDDAHRQKLLELTMGTCDFIDAIPSRDGYDAAITIGSVKPHLIVFVMNHLSTSTMAFCRALRRNPVTEEVRIVAVVSHNRNPNAVDLLKENKVDAVIFQKDEQLCPIEFRRILGIECSHAA